MLSEEHRFDSEKGGIAMGTRQLWAATCLTFIGALAQTSHAADLPGIPPAQVADYLHAVIEANRTFYTIHVVERMQKQSSASASETWRRDKTTLPLPAQFLREANELATMTGTKVRYRLMSLWPINPQNAPATEAERKRLEVVQQHPEQSATSTVTSTAYNTFKPPMPTAPSRRPVLGATMRTRRVPNTILRSTM